MALVRTLIACVAVATAGCGRDFDALFSGGGDAGDDGARPKGGDGGTPPSDAGACESPGASCEPRQECDDGRCSYACAACCTCGKYQCPSGGSHACRTTCEPGSKCDVGCDTDGECTLRSQGANAKFSCGEHANRCDVTCDQGGSCDVRCDSEGACAVSCAAGTSCRLSCTGRPTSCALSCASGAKKDCGNGVFTCDRDCTD